MQQNVLSRLTNLFCRTLGSMNSFPLHLRAWKSASTKEVKCPGFFKNNTIFYPYCKRDTLNSAVTAHWGAYSVLVCLTVGKDLWDCLSWRWNLPQRDRFKWKKNKGFTAPSFLICFFLISTHIEEMITLFSFTVTKFYNLKFLWQYFLNRST